MAVFELTHGDAAALGFEPDALDDARGFAASFFATAVSKT